MPALQKEVSLRGKTQSDMRRLQGYAGVAGGRVDDGLKSILAIQQATALFFGLPVTSICERRRDRRTARPRQIAMWLSRHLTGESLPTIGLAFDRDHTTIMHAIDTVEREIEHETDWGVSAVRLWLTLKSAREAA